MFECSRGSLANEQAIRDSDTSELLSLSTFGTTQCVSEVSDMTEIFALELRTTKTNRSLSCSIQSNRPSCNTISLARDRFP